MSVIPFSFSYTSADCMKRLKNARAIKASAITVDRNNQSAEISGSAAEPYRADLSGCSCPDFALQRKPCKHMIRLAIELGFEFDNPVFDTKKAAAYDMQAEIQHFYELWMNGTIHQDVYIDCIVALDKNEQKAGVKK